MSRHEYVLIAAALLFFAFFYRPDSSPVVVVPPTPAPAPSPDPTPVPKPVDRQVALDRVRAEDIQTYVTQLAAPEFQGRGTGTEGNRKAAAYLVARLDELNIPYKKQAFTARGKNTENIIGYLQPEKPESDEVIVVGAHFDHLGGSESSYYPGADDNASGTAAVMEIAEALASARQELKHTVLLQFYSAEEMGLLGSAHYCSNPLFPESAPDMNKHAAMINLDMIGFLRSADDVTPQDMRRLFEGENEEMPSDFSRSAKPVDMRGLVNKLSARYPFGPRISGYKPGGSDHAPFYRKSVPVVFLHTGTHPYYHKPTDTPNRLNYKGAEAVTRMATELVFEIDDFLSRGN